MEFEEIPRDAVVPDLRDAVAPDLRDAVSPDLRDAVLPDLRDAVPFALLDRLSPELAGALAVTLPRFDVTPVRRDGVWRVWRVDLVSDWPDVRV